jgi:hypothetical protein
LPNAQTMFNCWEPRLAFLLQTMCKAQWCAQQGAFFCISTDWLRICQEGALWPLIHRIIWLWTWRIPASQIFGDLKSQKVVGETGRLGNLEGQRPKGWGGLGCLPPWIGISWYIWYAHICSMFGQTHIVSPFDEYRCSWSSFKR